MPSPRRRLASGILTGSLIALSLLLCVLTAAVTVRSFLVRDRFERTHWRILDWTDGAGSTTHERHFTADSGRGVLHLSVFNNLTRRTRTPVQLAESRQHNAAYYGPGVVRWTHTATQPATTSVPPNVPTLAGLGHLSTSLRAGDQTSRSLFVPWALLSTIFALPPALFLFRRRRAARRAREGLCPACGYDLRHSPHACPECGWQPPAHPARLEPSAAPPPLTHAGS